MEAGFGLTGGTFDEHLKSTRICLRSARPLSRAREAVSKLMDSYRGQYYLRLLEDYQWVNSV